jgi:hypothetical protein
MTISLIQFARLGGKARAAALTAERRREIARAAGLAQCAPGKSRGRPAKSAKNNSFSTVVEHGQ